MKLLLLYAALAVVNISHAQMTVSGKISSPHSGKALVFNVPFDCWQYPANAHEVMPDREGKFSVRLAVQKPQIIFLIYAGQCQQLYAEPGKTLDIETDDSLKSIRFGGDLAKENQFRQQLGLTTYRLGKQTWNDTISPPEEILAELKKARKSALLTLNKSKLSVPFARMTAADIDYFAVSKLWDLIWKNGVWTSNNHSRYGQNAWRQALKAAHENVALSNDDAVSSYHYQIMVSYYPRYLQQLAASKDEFEQIAEAVFGKPFADINQEIRQKGERYWEYAALQYGFKGLAQQYAMASFLINGIDQGNLDYQQEAYQDFVNRFPRSTYMQVVSKKMKPFLESLARKDSESKDIHFVQDSNTIPMLDSIIARHKGRVLFIDLWGTWCGPCRQEFHFNQALKDRFKNKSVDFAYIAVEHRPDPEKSWREMIAFYHLTGYHMLAGKKLEEDLRKIYAQQGNLIFPSYILVDKSGKVATIHAKRPSDEDALYQQIEQLL